MVKRSKINGVDTIVATLASQHTLTTSGREFEMGTNEATRNMTRDQIQSVDALMFHWNQANPNALHGEWEQAWVATARTLGFVR